MNRFHKSIKTILPFDCTFDAPRERFFFEDLKPMQRVSINAAIIRREFS